ncbi:MAG: winged helix-turn-helix domain-containing protein [Rubrivivax sp.]|nr:winged helix-turn-helix domain-containing protein [Rubrivivax sp.]
MISLGLGQACIDTQARRLTVGGAPAKLGGRAFDLLLALVERHERVVSKDELMDLVWPGLVVEEGNLHVPSSPCAGCWEPMPSSPCRGGAIASRRRCRRAGRACAGPMGRAQTHSP